MRKEKGTKRSTPSQPRERPTFQGHWLPWHHLERRASMSTFVSSCYAHHVAAHRILRVRSHLMLRQHQVLRQEACAALYAKVRWKRRFLIMGLVMVVPALVMTPAASATSSPDHKRTFLACLSIREPSFSSRFSQELLGPRVNAIWLGMHAGGPHEEELCLI